MGDVLGEGAFSVVYSAIDRQTREKVAIKVIKKYQMDEKQRISVLKEVNLMKQLNHPNIVKLIDFIENENYFYIIQEIVSGGELFNQIVKYTYFSEDLSRHVIIQVAEALLYMHESVGIVHRDLKPENIFFKPIRTIKEDPKLRFMKLRKSDNPKTKLDEGKFTMNCGGGGIGLIKIGDFGLSKQISLNQNNSLKTPCGTIGYTAPEIVRDMRYSKEVDMWALGCVLYILLCGFPPFFNDSIEELTRTVARGEFKFLSPWWDEISQGAKNCVSQLLTVNPNQRYTVEQFLKDPWILEFLNRSENVQAQAQTQAQAQPTKNSRQVSEKSSPNNIQAGVKVTRISSGMPGFEPSNPVVNGVTPDSVPSVYSQSLLNIHCKNESSRNNIDNNKHNSDEYEESISDDSEYNNMNTSSEEFGVELLRFHHQQNDGNEPIPMLEHVLEPAPDKEDFRSEDIRISTIELTNDTTIKNKKKRNGMFTPEVMAMKDMYDFSIAAHRIHEEGQAYGKGTKIRGIVEEAEDEDEDDISGMNEVMNKSGDLFKLNMNDASILARRQKKRMHIPVSA
jgi:serine/threonine protein kinase